MFVPNAPRRSRVTSLRARRVPCPAALPAQQADPLASGFATPPATAHPRVWWHWMNGNITKEGITQDLDWMHRVGIVGFQNFDAAFNTPKVVDQRLIYMQPAWQDAFRFAIDKGDSYGFEMAIAGSPGWSETGGPWVKPEQAMKEVTWSATMVEGGKPFTGTLAAGAQQTGPFGNLAQQDLMGAMGGVTRAREGLWRGYCCARAAGARGQPQHGLAQPEGHQLRRNNRLRRQAAVRRRSESELFVRGGEVRRDQLGAV